MTKILVVDDELLSRKKIRRFIDQRPETFEILEASNGIEALNMIESQTPDIVFLDIEMPGMNGIEVVENVKDPSVAMFISPILVPFLSTSQTMAIVGLVAAVPTEPVKLAANVEALPITNCTTVASAPPEGLSGTKNAIS